MKLKALCLTLVLCSLPALARQQQRPAAAEEPPTEWIDRDTGHRVESCCCSR